MVVLGYLSLAAAALSSFATASPIASEKRGVTFSVTQEANARFTHHNGTLALLKAYRKYAAAIPKELAVAAGITGTVAATPSQYDAEYVCPVDVGGQTVNLDFDTGSADLWVFSTLLPASSRAGHNVYNPTSSSTYRKLSGYTWRISYGDGSGARGIVGTETVKVGGVTVTRQAVELATSVSAQFVSDTFNDGLLGLSFSSINTVQPVQQKTFFDNAKSILASPLFTADLKPQTPGSYDFGFIDQSRYTDSITWTAVDSSQGFWDFTASGYGVGSTFTASSYSGIADTGTTLLLLPDNIVNAYYGSVPSASYDSSNGGYTFPCSTSLPSFTVGIGSKRAVIPGSLMNFAPVDSVNCYGALQSSAGIGINIFGDILFKSQFVIFDGGNTRLGFANKS